MLRSIPLRRGLVMAALLFGVIMTVTGGAARADDDVEARQFITTLADKAIALVGNKAVNDEQRAQRFRTLFVNSFDIPEIGRFVLGRHWKTATAEQQQQFLKLFEDLTVLTWSRRFKDYSGVSLQILGVAPDNQGVLIDTQVTRQQGDPIPLNWHVHRTPAGWRITDIDVQGVSMALTQRQDFASTMQSSGGKVDGLLQALKAKVDQLRAG